MNVLMIGCGWIAETVYLSNFIENEKIKQIYVYDLDIKKIQNKLNKNSKIQCLESFENTKFEFDYVFILSPNFLHAETIKKFINQNVRIFVEKPICINQSEMNELVSSLKNTNVSLHVSAPFRYRQDFKEIKKLVDDYQFGDIYHVELSWVKRRGTPGTPWFTNKKLSGGGVLADMGPHLMDLFYWLFGYHEPLKYLSSGSAFFLNSGDAYSNWHDQNANREQGVCDVEDNCFSFISYKDISLSLNTTWASNIENDYMHLKIWGTKSVSDIFTSIGFSTNTLYKETIINLSSDGETKTTCLEIGNRVLPFHNMLTDYIDGFTDNIPNGMEALRNTASIFNLYDNMITVGEKIGK
ncbi:Gfo/Idh/MocA family oxidoreductase [Paenibacillus sp.]|jgi:predicted dehydrogenase|uniref:Gfo/Idh/MocA family protein n=1 Tax=Paenibacillus sp. TaxID=58172 RepID=UPI00281A1530|nr:Gfo/Idh/MocA family oxidoreductase [Paenibacillus sp.]MDR0270824.1 Gfo/Idh/MocA family oxidoreductase [Paenibacillus sp.]